MASWTQIPTSQIDQDSPVTQPLMVAIRDNMRAMAEAADDAPVVLAGWHPYDMVDAGDGADGLIYDHSVDGDVASITTADFVAGNEYAILFEGLKFTAGLAQTFFVRAYRNGAYTEAWRASSVNSGTELDGRFEFYRTDNDETPVFSMAYPISTYTNTQLASGYPITKAHIKFDTSNISGGKLWLLKRGSL